jgi:DNA-binding NarL/FixJ family response regulator
MTVSEIHPQLELPDEQPIRIMIVEDDPDWLRGISSLLAKQKDMVVVGQASNAKDAVKLAESMPIDITLMDVMMAGGPQGLQATEEISRRTAAKVIMLTSMEERDIIIGAFKAGAVDYVVKDNYRELPDTIRKAYDTATPMHPKAAEALREEIRRLKVMERALAVKEIRDRLTPMERQILQLISDGKTQTEIAEHYVISIRTVKIHVGNILRKLGETSSKEAARQAKDMGIID